MYCETTWTYTTWIQKPPTAHRLTCVPNSINLRKTAASTLLAIIIRISSLLPLTLRINDVHCCANTMVSTNNQHVETTHLCRVPTLLKICEILRTYKPLDGFSLAIFSLMILLWRNGADISVLQKCAFRVIYNVSPSGWGLHKVNLQETSLKNLIFLPIDTNATVHGNVIYLKKNINIK